MSKPPDVAETLVEIHVLVDETLVEKMDRKEIRVVHDWIDTILEISPYSAPFSRLGKIRSRGITDLRYGNGFPGPVRTQRI